jgi:hypothetical protein
MDDKSPFMMFVRSAPFRGAEPNRTPNIANPNTNRTRPNKPNNEINQMARPSNYSEEKSPETPAIAFPRAVDRPPAEIFNVIRAALRGHLRGTGPEIAG